MAQTQDSVLAYIKEVLDAVQAKLSIPDSKLVGAAKLTAATYGADYALFTDELKWRTLAEFYAWNVAVSYATPKFKFESDGTIIEGDDVFTHVQTRWKNALALAQGYLSDAGIIGVLPGGVAVRRNSRIRVGTIDLNYLTPEPPDAGLIS